VADLVAGAVLGETYRLLEPIGRGGAGTVWAAEHLRLPKRVAVKVLHRVPEMDSVAFARFRREAEITSRLDHPHIVQVVDFNVHESGIPYIVMPLLEGRSLRKRMLEGQLTFEDTRQYVRQMGSALEAAHGQGVVHRDLKPGNVFLVERVLDGVGTEQLKVLDFGTSKILGSTSVQTARATMIGTPQYMAPEQAAGDNERVGPHTDQFALASVAYEMLTGAPAFGTGMPAAIVYRVLHEPARPVAELRPDLPEASAAAIDRAMQKDPAERFETLGEFVRTFCGDAAPEPIEAPATIESALIENAPPPSADLPYQKTIKAPAPASGVPWTGLLSGLVVVGAVIAVVQWAPWPNKASPEPDTTSRAAPEKLDIVEPPVVAEKTVKPEPTIAPATPPAPAAASRPQSAPNRVARRGAADAPPPKARRITKIQLASPRKPPTKPVDPVAAAKAKADAKLAEQALGRGDFSKAMHLANRSLRHTRNARAAVVIAKANCGRGDLGGAKAALYKVPRTRRAAVIRYCVRKGVEL